ncbi:E3 ubiquitin-protein ligase RNF31 isoform X2 [Xenopus laevis]|uniref:Uncharacterized protein n=2 Tax=Xenopus laevis TaxID=8355 RepID=A0A974CQS2_XENLA|nr:E3 ubiquitin-protein ligase RNF31 isoform X2 [Xenopus laevis]OCT76935.1 hypothetical protein XELAEV_18032139mg [Xenopus laevis]
MLANRTSPDGGIDDALLKGFYTHAQRIKQELEQIRAKYGDILIKVGFHGGIKRRLLTFTVPVSTQYNGHYFQIQVCIWLHPTHPETPPQCYLADKVNIDLQPGDVISKNWLMNLKYVQEWNYTSSHLLGLLEDVEDFLKKEISARFTANCWNNKSLKAASTSPSISRTSQTSNLVSPRIDANVSPLLQKQQWQQETNKGRDSCSDIEDAFKSLTLESIVRMYDLKASSKDTEEPSNNTVCGIFQPSPGHTSTEKQKLFEDIWKVNRGFWSTEDVQEAVNTCSEYISALHYLSHECPICYNQYPFSKFVTMTHCSCSFCKACFAQYFSSVIKEKSISDAVCPLCKKPDLEKEGDTEEVMDYFNFLDTQIRHYLDQATHDLFQCKLRDRTLMKMPNFRWCCHCSFGLLHEADRLRMDCPSCCKSTCFKCRKPWEEQHEKISCEEFRIWKLNNEPSHQEERLNAYLTQNGIDCPLCKFRFDLAKGGCLHFRCTQCLHEFCEGCRQPFKHGHECDFSTDCHRKGLHAHHLRNCLYYMRDWDFHRLYRLLQESGIQYKANNGPGSEKDQWTNEDRRAASAIHKEYLVKIICLNALDPADLYTEKEMETELKRWKLTVPGFCSENNREMYLQRLRMIIKQEIPLPSAAV